MAKNDKRARKWKLYYKAKEWIAPYPEWFEKPNEYTLNDFVEHFKIKPDEAQKLIERLIYDKKLKKSDKEGTYIAIRICDICGKDFDNWDLQENHHHTYNFGYGSKHDLEYLEFDVCADCFDKIVDTILPLFPKSPLQDMECYQDKPLDPLYIQKVENHDNDPY